MHECQKTGIDVCVAAGQSPADARAAVTGLVPPGSVSAVATSATSILVSWVDTNSRENGYSVEQSLSATTGFTVVGMTGQDATSFQAMGLASGTTYYYRVRAVRRKGGGNTYSSYSPVVSATTPTPPDVTPPTAPSSLSATAVACTQVDLAWNASSDTGGSGLKGYNVYRNGTFMKQVLAPSTTTSDATAGSTGYSYTVLAVDYAGNASGTSNTAGIITPACPTTTTSTSTTTTLAPTTTTSTLAPTTTTTTLPPTTTTSTTTTLAPTTTTSTLAPTTTTTTLAPTTTTTTLAPTTTTTTLAPTTTTTTLAPTTTTSTTTSTTTTTLAPTTTTSTSTTTTISTTTTTAPDTAPPAIPTGLSASAVSCSQVNLSWNAVTDTGGSGLKAYNVYRNNAFAKQVLAPTTSTSDTALAESTVYAYAVSAVDQAGNESARSTSVSTNTPACPTGTVSAALMGYVPGVGPARDVVVDAASGTAYVASDEFGLAVVDVRTPSAPVVLGGPDQPFYGDHVATAGTLAVVGSTYAGVHVLDISTPAAPKVLGSLPGSTGGVAMNSTAAYVRVKVTGNPAHVDLAVVDIRTPTAPQIVSQTFLPGGTGIAMVGSYLYVAAGQSGLQIYDLTQPLAPVLRGSVTAANPIIAVAATTSGYAYVISGTSILVIDARTPSTPHVVGSYAAYALGIAASGSRLYAVDGSTLYTLDVSNPTAPILLSTTSAYGAQALAANGAMLYLASPDSDRSRNSGGLSIVDITVPSAPVLRGHALGGLDNQGVAGAGGMAVATGTSMDGGLQVIDVHNVATPRVVGKLAGSFTGVAMGSATVAYARMAVTGNPSHVDLAVVDLSTPSSPRIASQTFLPGGKGVAVVGSYLYVGAATNGLQIYDITSPLAPTLRGSVIPTAGAAGGLAVVNGYAYIVGSTSISVIDVRTPTSPQVVGSYATAPFALAASGNRLYGVDGSTLYTFGLTNPAAPALLSASAGYGAQGVATTGTLVYLAAPSDAFKPQDHALYVVDAGNGASPKLVDKVTLAGNARSAAVVGTYVFVGDTAGVVDAVVVSTQ